MINKYSASKGRKNRSKKEIEKEKSKKELKRKDSHIEEDVSGGTFIFKKFKSIFTGDD